MLIDNNIIKAIEECDKIKKENEFKDFLNQRKTSYAYDVFNKYSDNDLFNKGKNYAAYNRTEVSLQEIILNIVSPISVAMSIFVTYNMKMSNIYTGDAIAPVLLMVLAILMVSAGIILSPFFRKFVFKKWLKSHYDELLNYFLKDLPVSQDVLKRFIEVYGKEDLAIMMSQKDSLTCGDIFSYVNNSKAKNKIKDQREKLNEALDQLVFNK